MSTKYLSSPMTSKAVLDGFRADTELLLSSFVQKNSTKFECFCDEWKRMNFQYVFCGYLCMSEMVQFLEDAFVLLKHVFLDATLQLEKIGALYLMYTMYFKQPSKIYCKFRVTLSEWMKINQFYNEVCIFYEQASLIFWKLLQNDAFRFVEAEHEYGFERFMQKGDDSQHKFKQINPVVERTLSAMKEPRTGILTAIHILQVGYNEMKEYIDPTFETMPETTILTDITNGLENIEKLLKADTAMDEQEDDSQLDDALINHDSTKRRLKKKAFEGEEGVSEEPTKKTVSRNYRTSVIDEGEFIKINKATQVKVKKSNLSGRGIKTFIKQLEVPIEDDEEMVPTAGTSKKV